MDIDNSVSVISNLDTSTPKDEIDFIISNKSIQTDISSSYSSDSSNSSSYSNSSSSYSSSSENSSSDESSISSYSSKKKKNNKKRKRKNKKNLIIDKDEEMIDEKGFDQIKLEELPIPEFATEENAEFIELKNSFMNELDEKFLKMTPYELFLFHYDELINSFVVYSNKYAEINYKWTVCNIERDDIIKYIFCYIYLSIYDLPEIEMLWETSKFFKSIIPSIIKKSRYCTLNKYFFISKKLKEDKKNKSETLSELLETLNSKWKQAYPYTKYLSIDEAMTSYKGNISFKQYNKAKHKRHGIKLFSKASSDKGYCYHMLLYTGKSFNYDKTCGIGTTIIKKLTQGHESNDNKENIYHFTFDSFFSNLHTFNFLENNKINFTCTFALNKKAIPKKIKNINLSTKNNIKLYQIKNSNVKFFLCKDNKRQIQLASNCYDIQKRKYKNKKNKIQLKHEMIAYYNLTKSGVDLIDSATQVYKTQRKTNKWWKAVFFYLLDVTLNNCCIIYYSSNKYHELNERNKALMFRRKLIEQFVNIYNKCQITNTIGFVKEIHILIPEGKWHKQCFNCLREKKEKINKTKFMCNICRLSLCKDCFIFLHENMN